MLYLGIIIGIILSWVDLLWLRRNVYQMLSDQAIARNWSNRFLLRWATVAICLIGAFQFFKSNIFPFVISFLTSNLIFRLWYGRKAYA